MAIRIDKLEKRYKSTGYLALKGVSMHVPEGEFYGLLGPNGSGKTTLISILCGIFPPSGGEALVNGHHSEYASNALKSSIGLVPQVSALYPSLSLIENLRYFGSMQGLTAKRLAERIDYCIEVAQLGKFARNPVASYSGGMRQRANIVTGIIHEPKVLFLDEPTVGVDPQSREMIFDCLRGLNAHGVTMVYTTHYMEEAESLCTRVGILNEGELMIEDETKALIASRPNCSNLGDLFLEMTGRELRD